MALTGKCQELSFQISLEIGWLLEGIEDTPYIFQMFARIIHLRANTYFQKTSFRPSKWLRMFRTRKTAKVVVNCAIIKENEKQKEVMVRVQVELVGGHQYSHGSPHPPN